MRNNPVVLIAALWALALAAPSVHADELEMKQVVSADELKANVTQPYVVKKGDTLWDIADHFFKDPWKWLNIWERNLYITNPDLIYPGNKIWFDGKRPGGLKVVKLQPQVVIKPVERLEGPTDTSVMMTALQRQDFIHPDEVEGVGHIVDSRDERINFGLHDNLYLMMKQPVEPGTLYDIFRTTDTISDPVSGDELGVLVIHVGQVRVDSQAGGVHRGVVVKAFEEISRGDRLKPARDPNLRIVPHSAGRTLQGSILYIRDDGRAAGQNQVVGISLGASDGVEAGTTLGIYRSGRVVEDRVTGDAVKLPDEKVGELIVLVPQAQASMALITDSTSTIHIGDAALSENRP